MLDHDLFVLSAKVSLACCFTTTDFPRFLGYRDITNKEEEQFTVLGFTEDIATFEAFVSTVRAICTTALSSHL